MQVWNSYLIKDIQKLEAVQKFVLGVYLKRWNSAYSDLLYSSEVSGLADCMKILSLMYFYKVVNGHITVPDSIIVARAQHT